MGAVDLTGLDAIDRAKLFELVWLHSMTDLGRAVGLSNVLLHRLCKRWDIPTPTKSQRGTMIAGRHVQRPLLPAAGGATSPVVLWKGQSRYSSSFPVKPRQSRKKPNPLDGILARYKAKKEVQEAQDIAIQKRIDERAEGPREIYIYRIKRWWPVYRCDIDPLGNEDPEEGITIILDGVLTRPRNRAKREAAIEISFSGYGEYLSLKAQRSAGWCELGGTGVVLHAPRASAAGVTELLCAGLFQHLKVTVFAVPRHRVEEVECFELLSKLNEGDLL